MMRPTTAVKWLCLLMHNAVQEGRQSEEFEVVWKARLEEKHKKGVHAVMNWVIQ